MKTSFINNLQRDFGDALNGSSSGAAAGAAAGPDGAAAGAIIGFIGGLFKKETPLEAARGWDSLTRLKNQPDGTSAAWWIITDGDSVQNEAKGVLSYIHLIPNGLSNIYNAASQVYSMNETQFTAKLVDKLKRAGYQNEAAQFAQSYSGIANDSTSGTSAPVPQYQTGAATPMSQGNVHTQMPMPSGNTGIYHSATTPYDTSTAAKSAANKKTWLIVGVIGCVIVLAGVVFALVKFSGKGK